MTAARALLELAGLVGVAAWAALARTRRSPPRARWLVSGFRRLARHRTLSVATAGLAAFCYGPLVCGGRAPEPRIHDEFSYLLAADTYARGRLTNPTPPSPAHFQTFHVLLTPTYQSKFPPGQGLVLALGQLLAGRPILGVWLSMAAAWGSLCWMLRGFVPPRWALLGALLGLLRIGVFSSTPFFVYWGSSYFGGALAMLGGCLLFGSLPRLLRRARVGDGVALGVGADILLGSRPFEGSVAIAVALAALGLGLWRRAPVSPTVKAPLVAGTLVIAAGLAGLCGYNLAVTGDAFRPPYAAYQAAYDPVPLFVWQAMGSAPAELPPPMQHYVEWRSETYQQRRSAIGIARSFLGRAFVLGEFLLGPALAAALATSSLAARGVRLGTAGIGLSLLVLAPMAVWTSPHYLAPVAPLVFLLAVQALRRMRTLRSPRRLFGRRLAAGILALACLALPLALLSSRSVDPKAWYLRRARIETQLAGLGGRHLVLVRYGPNHSFHLEWVFNGAEPASAAVVWARDLGRKANAPLLAAFKGRRFWTLDADKRDASPIPLEDADGAGVELLTPPSDRP